MTSGTKTKDRRDVRHHEEKCCSKIDYDNDSRHRTCLMDTSIIISTSWFNWSCFWACTRRLEYQTTSEFYLVRTTQSRHLLSNKHLHYKGLREQGSAIWIFCNKEIQRGPVSNHLNSSSTQPMRWNWGTQNYWKGIWVYFIIRGDLHHSLRILLLGAGECVDHLPNQQSPTSSVYHQLKRPFRFTWKTQLLTPS